MLMVLDSFSVLIFSHAHALQGAKLKVNGTNMETHMTYDCRVTKPTALTGKWTTEE